MNSIQIMFISIFVLIILWIFFKTIIRNAKESKNWPFYLKRIMSVPEQFLYFKLCKVLPEYIVLSQVGLSRIIGVKKGYNFHEWNNRINRMSVDFLVCKKDASIVAVIELDDKSHNRSERLVADAKKDKALLSAGIRIIRWVVNNVPEEAGIREAILNTHSDEYHK